MKQHILFAFAVLSLPWISMCRPGNSNVVPISKICRYDGAHSGDTVKVICTGIGSSQETAFIDAKKAATWYVVSKMLDTEYERKRFDLIHKQFYARYNTFLSKADTDGTYKQDDSGRAQVEAQLQVNRSLISAYLKENRVVDLKKIREQVGNPTVAVVTKWKTRDPRWESFVKGSASEFLTERRYNTLDLTSGMKGLNKLTKALLKSEQIPVDKKFRAAMAMGADVYIEVSAWVENVGASTKGAARVKIYETTTGKLIGDSPAFGRSYPRTAQSEFRTVKEAVQNATEKSLGHAMKYWREDAVKGNRYYIVLAGKLDAVQDMTDLLSLKLKKMKGVQGFRRSVATAKRMIVTFQSKLDQTEMSLTLKKTLRGASGVKTLKIPLMTRKFFLCLLNVDKQVSVDSDTLPPGL